MSNILINKLNDFKNYEYDQTNKNIINLNKSNADVNEFFEIIHLLDSKFVNYSILNDFNIDILSKR